MTNPVIHALAIVAAIIIPGGLLVYFAWRFRNRRIAADKAEHARDPIEEIREAFLSRYPKESLHAKNRRERLARAARYRRFNPKKPPQ